MQKILHMPQPKYAKNKFVVFKLCYSLGAVLSLPFWVTTGHTDTHYHILKKFIMKKKTALLM